jgi:hypothetical protein
VRSLDFGTHFHFDFEAWNNPRRRNGLTELARGYLVQEPQRLSFLAVRCVIMPRPVLRSFGKFVLI